MKDRKCHYRLVRRIVSLKYTVGSELKLTPTSYAKRCDIKDTNIRDNCIQIVI